MIKCQVVMEAMDRLAPRYLAEEWDNVGLLIGSPAQDVHKILTCLDVTEKIIDRAVAENYDMIISHHPFLFRAMKRIATDKPLGRMVQKILSNNIAVFAAHTNLDTTFGGVNDVLAQNLNLTDLKPLTVSYREEILKLGVNVPVEHIVCLTVPVSFTWIGNFFDLCFTPNHRKSSLDDSSVSDENWPAMLIQESGNHTLCNDLRAYSCAIAKKDAQYWLITHFSNLQVLYSLCYLSPNIARPRRKIVAP